ncbi:hypothetical protein ACKWTF_009754 [Chironomus riparius]
MDEDSTEQSDLENDDRKLLEKIQKCRHQCRVLASNENFDIFTYLELKYSREIIILEAFMAIAATPSNQSSVERCFSALRILLSHLRFNLKPTSIDDIMICHLNYQLLSKIDYESINI